MMLVFSELQTSEPLRPEQEVVSRHRRSGKWISVLGWLLTAAGGISLLLGLSDWQNLIALTIIGIFFIPIGLLLVVNGQVLIGLARIEKNTQATTKPPAKPPEPG
jgi:magnesium-transporting ATPase (P-type)